MFIYFKKIDQLKLEEYYYNLENKDDFNLIFNLFNVNSIEKLIKVNKDDLEFKISILSELKSLLINNWNEEFKKQEEEDETAIKELEIEKNKLEKIIKNAKNNGILNWFTKDYINEAIKKPLEKIEILNEEINEIKKNSLNGKDLDRFVEAIGKIFEHTSNMLWQANN